MPHTKSNRSLFSCWDRALPDEPVFELLARDPSFGRLVRSWADEREAAIRAGDRPTADLSQVREARECAEEGEKWRRDNLYKWRREPEAGEYRREIETSFPRMRVPGGAQ